MVGEGERGNLYEYFQRERGRPEEEVEELSFMVE